MANNDCSIICVGYGKFDLPRPGMKEWVPASHLLIDTLIDARRFEMNQQGLSAAMVAMGRSPSITGPLTTLQTNDVVARTDGGLIKLTAVAVEKIKLGKTIRSRYGGGVLWMPRAVV